MTATGFPLIMLIRGLSHSRWRHRTYPSEVGARRRDRVSTVAAPRRACSRIDRSISIFTVVTENESEVLARFSGSEALLKVRLKTRTDSRDGSSMQPTVFIGRTVVRYGMRNCKGTSSLLDIDRAVHASVQYDRHQGHSLHEQRFVDMRCQSQSHTEP